MWNRREILSRMWRCRQAGVPICNYGPMIAYTLGIFDRAGTVSRCDGNLPAFAGEVGRPSAISRGAVTHQRFAVPNVRLTASR